MDAMNSVTSKYFPLVTVITVARNALNDLRQTIDSVLAQNYPNVQFIVIDGGSTDGSTNLLEDKSNCIEYISEPDKGIYDAMNKALDRVRGKWMLFLNAGDKFASPESIQRFVDNAADNVSLVYSDYLRPVSVNPEKLELCCSHDLIGRGGVVRMICHQAIFFNVSHFPGYYDCDLKLCADLDVLLKIYISGLGVFHHLPEPLVIYQGGGVSESDYLSLHNERNRIIRRYFSWLVISINWLNHIRIRCCRAIDG